MSAVPRISKHFKTGTFFNLELRLGQGSTIYEIDGTKCGLRSVKLFLYKFQREGADLIEATRALKNVPKCNLSQVSEHAITS